ncbi:MAG: aminotransferase [Pseudomonadota bacterium]
MAHFLPFTDPILAESKPARQFVKGEGIRVTDESGKSYIDAVSALWCSSLGFSPERLTRVATQQMQKMAYYHSFMGRTPAIANQLAERLVKHLPGDMSHILFGTSGSEAVETASKIVRFYQNSRGKTEKKRIIARHGAYHGSGQMSAALTGLTYCHDGFDLPLNSVLRTGRPHYIRDAEPGESEIEFSKRRARELDALIRKEDADTIAAFIGEPAMGAGGVILPPEGYWSEIQEVLKKHDILLIADEIICGFGRTGEWFACETYGIKPDLMTLAKQLTASVFPMSAVAMSREVRDQISTLAHDYGTFGHGVTYGGHPVGAAIALECLAIYEEMDLPNHVKGLGSHLNKRLEKLKNHPGVLDVRCNGLLAAVEFETSQQAQLVGLEAERSGVFFRIISEVLAIAPPYICTPVDIDEIMDVMTLSIESVLECAG